MSELNDKYGCYGQYMKPGSPWAASPGGCSQDCPERLSCYRLTNGIPDPRPEPEVVTPFHRRYTINILQLLVSHLCVPEDDVHEYPEYLMKYTEQLLREKGKNASEVRVEVLLPDGSHEVWTVKDGVWYNELGEPYTVMEVER